jgi:hypothetical protein
MLRASALLDLHGPQRALPDGIAAMRECLRSGVDRLICYAASQAFAIELAAGRPRAAARWAREVISIARSAQHNSFVALGLSNLASALAVSGDPRAAREALDALDPEPDERRTPDSAQPTWTVHAQAWTLAAEGRLSVAAEMLVAGATGARARGQWSVAGTLLHDAVRLGGAKAAVVGLRDVAEHCTSPLAARQSRQALAVLAADVDELAAVAREWETIGSRLLAAEAYLAAGTPIASIRSVPASARLLRWRPRDCAAGRSRTRWWCRSGPSTTTCRPSTASSASPAGGS